MGGDGGTQGRWSDDLPDDLLGAIYSRCSSSSHRARFASVCRSWRAAASWQPRLPALPLLLPSTGNGSVDMKALAYSPEDGRVLRAPLPRLPYGKRIVGSYPGGWVAAAIGCRIDVVNLFTCAWELSKREITCLHAKCSTRKVVFSTDPSSKEGCILAAMVSTSCIALGRIVPGEEWFIDGPRRKWTTGGCCAYPTHISDILFSNGDLYALSHRDYRLYKFAIRNNYNFPVLEPLEELTIQPPRPFDPHCIFELDSKIATAVEVAGSSKARTFRVFELARNDTTESYKLVELTSLGDHALFLGPAFCKAVRVPAVGTRGEVQSNCIYYSHPEEDDHSKCLAALDLGSCTVYCYESRGVDHSESERIMTRGYHYSEKADRVNDRNSCTWILPPQF